MKKWFSLIFSLLLIGTYFISSVVGVNKGQGYCFEEETAKEHVERTQMAKIVYQQGLRNEKYYQMVINEQALFVSYGKSSCVDAYNHEGNFLFSVILPDYSKGAVCISGEGENVIVISKKDDVYIVEPTGQVRLLDKETAMEKGYSGNWCREQNKKQVISVGKESIVLKDLNGTILAHIKTPAPIADNLPWVRMPFELDVCITISGLLFLITCTIVLTVKKYKAQKDDHINDLNI